MNLLVGLIVAGFFALPWLAMAALAGLAARKQKGSMPLILQCLGALAGGLLILGQWAIVTLLLVTMLKAYDYVSIAGNIFRFLEFVALAAFAAGYCLEKFKKRSAS